MSRTAGFRHGVLVLIAAGLSSLTAAACGGGGDAKPAAQPAVAAGAPDAAAGPDACALLPGAELERILGTPLGPAEPGQSFSSGEASMTACAWKTVDGRAGVSLSLRRGPQYRPDPAAFEEYAAGFEANMGTRPEVQPVPGLGSAALWDATNHVLMVRPKQPGAELSVQPYLGRTVPMIELPQARALAEVALPRIGGTAP